MAGNDENQPINLTGSQGALPIVGQILRAVDNTAVAFTQPENIATVKMDGKTGDLLGDCDSGVIIPFIKIDRKQATNESIRTLIGLDCSKESRKKGIKSWLKKLFD